MPLDLQITSLPESAVDAAADLLARAFFDDPLFSFVFPDETTRAARLRWIMRVGATYGCRFGRAETTAGAMLGHAVWFMPGAASVAESQFEDAGFVEPARHMGHASLERFAAFMEEVAPRHERLMPDRHWHLMILGVDPPHQGQGVGSTLIRPTLARADAEGLRCYLETANPRNVAFYRRHGFEVAEETDIGGGGPHVWLMIRGARARTIAA